MVRNDTVIMEIHGFSDRSMFYHDALSLAKCFEYYAENFAGDDIMEIGYNSKSGMTYIELETGECIACVDAEEAYEHEEEEYEE